MPETENIDLENCVTASTKESHRCQTPPGSNAGRKLAIAIQHLDERAVMINVTIQEEGDGYLVFSSAKKQMSKATTKRWHQRLVGKLLMGLVGGTARVKPATYCGPTVSPSRVYLQDFTLDPLLTEALHNPHLLLHSGTYPLDVGNFGSSPTDDNTTLGHGPARSINDLDRNPTTTYTEHNDQEIIVVRWVIDRAKVAWLLILLLFFSPVLGIGVGICSHNAEVGIAISAGVFALASFVQGLVAWVEG